MKIVEEIKQFVEEECLSQLVSMVEFHFKPTVKWAEKLERKWKQLHFEESKELIRPKLEAVRLLFS